MPEGCIVCGNLKTGCICRPKYVAMPTFKAMLLHKLEIITKEAGTKTRAARKIGVHRTTLLRWWSERKGFSMDSLASVDAAYAMAIERLNLKARKRAEAI